MNAIIGGKGTGKSSLIETIRHVIEAPASRIDELKKNRQRNFPANADCTIGFIDESGEAYEAKRSGGSTGARLFRSGVASDVHVGRRLQVRVFGQRELQGLVDAPGDLLGFVAGQAGPEWDEVVGEELRLLGELSTADEELQGLEQTVGKLGEKQDELNDLTERLERAKEQGVEELLSQSSKLATAARSIRDALAWPSKVEGKVSELQGLLQYSVLPEEPAAPTGLAETLGRLAQAVESAAKLLGAAVDATEQVLPGIKASWEATEVEQRGELERRLAEAGITNPQELAGIQGDIAKLQAALAALPERQTKHQSVSEQRAGYLTRLGELCRKKSRLIEQASTRLNERLAPRVRVVINPLADHGPLQEAIEAAVRSQSVSKTNVQQLASQEPAVLVAAARSGATDVEQLGVTASTAAKIADLKPTVLRNIEEADTPDGIDLQINIAPTGEEDWTSIHDLSPGQRSTALLALALTAGEEPLLIDQPEDDLDNRYIFVEVVQVLARVCQRRQVIVATHNANLPILGDAEMVVALDAGASKGRVLAAGGWRIQKSLNKPGTSSKAETRRSEPASGVICRQSVHRRRNLKVRHSVYEFTCRYGGRLVGGGRVVVSVDGGLREPVLEAEVLMAGQRRGKGLAPFLEHDLATAGGHLVADVGDRGVQVFRLVTGRTFRRSHRFGFRQAKLNKATDRRGARDLTDVGFQPARIRLARESQGMEPS